jgi:hypothetical protein
VFRNTVSIYEAEGTFRGSSAKSGNLNFKEKAGSNFFAHTCLLSVWQTI